MALMTRLIRIPGRSFWRWSLVIVFVCLFANGLQGREQPLLRNYSRTHPVESMFGPHWRCNFDIRLFMVAGEIDRYAIVRLPSGKVAMFQETGYHTYASPAVVAGTLTQDEDDLFTIEYDSGYTWAFDAEDRISSISTPQGLATTFAYDVNDRLETVTEPDGHAWTLTYNAKNKVSQVGDGTNSWTYGYDGDGNLTDAYYPDGGHVVYGYNSPHNPHWLTSTSNRRGQVIVTQDYDLWGQLIERSSSGRSYVVTHGSFFREEYPEDDPDHIVRRYYDSRQRLVQELRVETGEAREYWYDSDTSLLMVSFDFRGGQTLYSYDATGNRAATMDPLGNITHFSYDSNDRLLRTTDALGNTTFREYDNDGNVTLVMDALGNSTAYTYTSSGLVSTMVGPLGYTTTYEYDTSAHLVSRVRSMESTEVAEYFDYDADGNRSQVTDGRGNSTDYAYDLFGRVTSITYPEVAAGATEVTTRPVMTYVYDVDGNVIEQTDSLGRSTETSYDAWANRISLINPLGLTTTYAYSYGKLTTTTDPLGRETHYSYDSLGRTIRVTDALGGEVSFTYDADGNRIGTTDQRGHETLTSVDALNRVTSVTYPDDAVAKRSYNAVGNLVRTTDALGNETLFEYDAAGRQTARVDPEGERTEYEYDAAGNRTAVVRAAGTGLEVRDEYTYDALGRLIEVTRAINTDDEVTVTYGYDANGNLTSITNGRGYAWTFEYDAMNRLVAEIDPLDRTRDYAYDLAGQLVEKRDPKGQKIQYDYDDGGRVTEARYIRVDDTTENTARMAYDSVGNMVEVTDTNVDISQTFDDLNRITIITHDHLDKTQRQGWDAAGNRTWMSVDEIENSTAAYTWDSRNQLTEIDHDTMGTVSYTYNAAGQKITMVLPNDIDCDYTYDANGRLTNLDYRKPDTTQVFFEDLTYDARGNITRRVDDEGTHDYQYDDLDQLTRADYPDSTYEQFAYDAAGNRTSVTTSGGTAVYTVDIADQLTQIDGPGASEVTTMGWTDNGEMASQLHSSATTPTTYGWDSREMLVQVSIPDTGFVTHAYAPPQWLGWRIASTDPQGVTSKMLWDKVSQNSMAILHSDGTTSSSHLFSSRIDDHLVQRASATQQSWFSVKDHLASITKLISTSAEAIATYRYSTYGTPRTWTTPPELSSRLTFTAREFWNTSQLYYYRARWYGMRTGRFRSVDPVLGQLRYSYVNNNPVRYWDPLGTEADAATECPDTCMLKTIGDTLYAFQDPGTAQVAYGKWTVYALRYYKKGRYRCSWMGWGPCTKCSLNLCANDYKKIGVFSLDCNKPDESTLHHSTKCTLREDISIDAVEHDCPDCFTFKKRTILYAKGTEVFVELKRRALMKNVCEKH